MLTRLQVIDAFRQFKRERFSLDRVLQEWNTEDTRCEMRNLLFRKTSVYNIVRHNIQYANMDCPMCLSTAHQFALHFTAICVVLLGGDTLNTGSATAGGRITIRALTIASE